MKVNLIGIVNILPKKIKRKMNEKIHFCKDGKLPKMAGKMILMTEVK